MNEFRFAAANAKGVSDAKEHRNESRLNFIHFPKRQIRATKLPKVIFPKHGANTRKDLRGKLLFPRLFFGSDFLIRSGFGFCVR